MNKSVSLSDPLVVTRAELIELLKSWQHALISVGEVHIWSEQRYIPGRFIVDDEEGENSVCSEVLQHFNCLDMNLVIEEDIPAMLDFLSTPVGQFESGYDKWNKIT